MQPMQFCIHTGRQLEETVTDRVAGNCPPNTPYAHLQVPQIPQNQTLTTHTGEIPNECSQCDFASTQAGHLRRQLQTEWWAIVFTLIHNFELARAAHLNTWLWLKCMRACMRFVERGNFWVVATRADLILL